MTDAGAGEVPVTFAKGVLDNVAELTATTAEDSPATKAEAEALQLRIAELLVECKVNPFVGELMVRASTQSSPIAAGFVSTSPSTEASPAFG